MDRDLSLLIDAGPRRHAWHECRIEQAVRCHFLFSSSSSEQKTYQTDNTVQAEGPVAAHDAALAQEESIVAKDASFVGSKQEVQNATLTNSNVTFGLDGEALLDVLGKQAAASSETVQLAVETGGEQLSSALDKLSTAVSGAQTEGASILTKQIGWIILAALGLLAAVLIWGKK